ncbi:hypothetical protein [Homoserinibacter sp. YIM 151385]|uniref:hypothetical protein n=1 Tax=Homoserinibacter sp. YIM 151385 TaxID=2985506 RepID=UPI0022F0E7EE|nr:hypothetical protein [Homoserinibacter sp. YIM 151385]WBU38393.1 hypothetical protein OF852_02070 [Homoserinibacter sp. YIM 151385]
MTPAMLAFLFAALSTLVLLVADAVTGTLDLRTAREDEDLEQLTRSRARETTWTVAVASLIAVLTAVGADVALRAAAKIEGLGPGLALLALVWAAVLVTSLVAAFAAVRRERPAYARLRRDLRDRIPLVLDADELAAFEARLARADRRREQRFRASLLLRWAGVAIVLVSALVLATGLDGAAWAVGIGIVVALLALAAAIVGHRADLARAEARRTVHEQQRREVLALLERARIPARRAVPGLRDRVSRALAILREQQR